MTRRESEMTCGDPGAVAVRIATARKADRMTQAQLADAARISVSLLRKIEQGRRAATPAVLESIARVLRVEASRLSGDFQPDWGRIRQAVLPIRYALDCHDLPDRGPAKQLDELRVATEVATAHRLSSRYTRLADALPPLLSQLHRAAHTYGGHQRETVFALLVMAYRAADAIADKYGFQDLSARAIELMRQAARQTGEPLLCGVAEYVRAELFFGRPHAVVGLRALEDAATCVDPGSSGEALAVYGSLHMRAAVLAASAGAAGRAASHLAEARDAAERVPDGVYYGTAFGPSSVRIHDVAAAAEQGDAAGVLARAQGWRPSLSVPAERRSHYFIELARAQMWAGDSDAALASLDEARRIAPQHTQCNPEVHKTLLTLMRLRRRAPDHLLSFASWAGVR
jgi:transcriptional regulator with XRE-family HTH domain